MGSRTYYAFGSDQEGLICIYIPNQSKPPEIVNGTREYAIAQDERYIVFSARKDRPIEFSQKDQKDMATRLLAVHEHPCVAQSWVVEKDMIIAEYVGVDVKKHFGWKGKSLN